MQAIKRISIAALLPFRVIILPTARNALPDEVNGLLGERRTVGDMVGSQCFHQIECLDVERAAYFCCNPIIMTHGFGNCRIVFQWTQADISYDLCGLDAR